MYTKIDGKQVSQAVRARIAEETASLKSKGIEPGLAVIIVGNDPASRVYVNNKKKACEQTGINSFEYAMAEDTSTEELISLIEKLNNDKRVSGILCQLPVPKQIDEERVLNAISPDKDVDGFHPVNCGRLMTGCAKFAPCTPAGMVEMLKYYNIPIAGKHCVIIGRSNIVGKPMAMLMLANNATVTVCHSKTDNLPEITKQADILVAAVGKPKFVTAEMVKDGAVVLDVGINRMENGKLCGDVDFDAVCEKTSYITPVPGGVGPMTITMLLQNTLTAASDEN
ncbi:MAG: bifunctional methylenetetrahydrofolate dehydrogenase/methenyltetrahydrofolate cyclohydrolase FolD [Clostridiales bacterium]|nr:bifunctional methylenetetrahydrofolate dehydrogenase/methenyltetrahydrofolate cyclohydrolase FolD [Clostridiales bacterium]